MIPYCKAGVPLPDGSEDWMENQMKNRASRKTCVGGGGGEGGE